MKDNRKITVGEFLDLLKNYDRDRILYFGGLDFYRLKNRDPNVVQCEFDQSVYPDQEGRIVIENQIK